MKPPWKDDELKHLYLKGLALSHSDSLALFDQSKADPAITNVETQKGDISPDETHNTGNPSGSDS